MQEPPAPPPKLSLQEPPPPLQLLEAPPVPPVVDGPPAPTLELTLQEPLAPPLELTLEEPLAPPVSLSPPPPELTLQEPLPPAPPPQLPEASSAPLVVEETPAPTAELTLLEPLAPPPELLPEATSAPPVLEEPPSPQVATAAPPEARKPPATPPELRLQKPSARQVPPPPLRSIPPRPPKASSAPPEARKPPAPTQQRTPKKPPAPPASLASQAPPVPPPRRSRPARRPQVSRSSPAAQALPAQPISGSQQAVAVSAQGANVIALSADRALIERLRDSVAGFHRVWRADDVAHAGELLVTATNPVFLIDGSLAGCDARALAKQLHEQFPDLAIIVAGRRDDEALFAPLVSSGVIFRCLHDPDSAENIRNLVDATQGGPRRKTDLPVAAVRPALVGAIAGTLAAIKLPKIKLPKIRVDRTWVRRWSGRCLRLAALLLAGWVLAQWKPWNYAAELFASEEPVSAASVAIDNEAKLRKLLDDAGIALARDRLVGPPGRNALELYRAALELNPDSSLAQFGIDNVADKLLAEAERALQERNLPELASAIDAARSARPDHPRLQHYSLQLKRERERMYGPEKPQAASTTANP